MKKISSFFLAGLLALSIPLAAIAVNDLSVSSVTLNLLTSDTAASTNITATSGTTTELNVESNYIDISLSNGSDITFTNNGSVYFVLTVQSGSGSSYRDCPGSGSTLNITSTGTSVVRMTLVATAPSCVSGGGGSTPAGGGGGSAGGGSAGGGSTGAGDTGGTTTTPDEGTQPGDTTTEPDVTTGETPTPEDDGTQTDETPTTPPVTENIDEPTGDNVDNQNNTGDIGGPTGEENTNNTDSSYTGLSPESTENLSNFLSNQNGSGATGDGGSGFWHIFNNDTDGQPVDSDDDNISDSDELFLTFTDPSEDSDDVEVTAGVTGQIRLGDNLVSLKAKNRVYVTGILRGKNVISCTVEKSPGMLESDTEYACEGEFIRSENDLYMMEFIPRDGDGFYIFRVEDENGLVTRFELTVDSKYKVGAPNLFEFDGFRDDYFTYPEELKVIVNPEVTDQPLTVVDPTGCVAFGDCVVQAKWNSLIFSSVVLADSSAGRIVINPPEGLELGEHRLLLTTIDTLTNEISDTLIVNFVVGDVEPLLGDGRFLGLTYLEGAVLGLFILLLIIAMLIERKRRKRVRELDERRKRMNP